MENINCRSHAKSDDEIIAQINKIILERFTGQSVLTISISHQKFFKAIAILSNHPLLTNKVKLFTLQNLYKNVYELYTEFVSYYCVVIKMKYTL